MTDVYVVGYDGADSAHRAVDFAAAQAKSSGARVHLVNVLEWSPYSFHTPEELNQRHKRREEEIERATATVEPAVAKLKEAGIDATCEVRHGHAGELLCTIATDMNAAQIVIGRTGDSGLAQRLLGSLAFTLAQTAPVPLTIVP